MTTLTKTLILAASPADVWAYLTDPDKIATWFHRLTTPFQVGHVYEKHGTTSGDKLLWGTITTMQPHDLLEYTFNIAPLAGHETNVCWELQPLHDGTQLTLTHSNLPDGAPAMGLITALDGGWDGHLADLRTNLKP